jgi:superoxide dismutase
LSLKIYTKPQNYTKFQSPFKTSIILKASNETPSSLLSIIFSLFSLHKKQQIALVCLCVKGANQRLDQHHHEWSQKTSKIIAKIFLRQNLQNVCFFKRMMRQKNLQKTTMMNFKKDLKDQYYDETFKRS